VPSPSGPPPTDISWSAFMRALSPPDTMWCGGSCAPTNHAAASPSLVVNPCASQGPQSRRKVRTTHAAASFQHSSENCPANPAVSTSCPFLRTRVVRAVPVGGRTNNNTSDPWVRSRQRRPDGLASPRLRMGRHSQAATHRQRRYRSTLPKQHERLPTPG
jgi:hypothetical protein